MIESTVIDALNGFIFGLFQIMMMPVVMFSLISIVFYFIVHR